MREDTAFPVVVGNSVNDKGMSLRDWFAGQALTGMLAADEGVGAQWAAFAEDAYRVADAMLKARKAPGT